MPLRPLNREQTWLLPWEEVNEHQSNQTTLTRIMLALAQADLQSLLSPKRRSHSWADSNRPTLRLE